MSWKKIIANAFAIFSIGAGLGISASSRNLMGSLNLSGRFYGGGLGTTGTTGGQTGLSMDMIASPALTFGKGTHPVRSKHILYLFWRM